MFRVKSSQRRNSPRINRFQQENRGRGRKRGLAGDGCGLESEASLRSDCIPRSLAPYLPPQYLFPSLCVPPSLCPHTHSFLPLHSPASGSGIDLWLHAVCFPLWNCLDMYVILRNYKSVTSTVCDLSDPNPALTLAPFDLFSEWYSRWVFGPQ